MTTQDAVEAGDTTFVRSRIEALEARLDSLAQERRCAELSDDFAYTNGTMRRLGAQMDEVRRQIEQLLAA